jgi:hypothetical protein
MTQSKAADTPTKMPPPGLLAGSMLKSVPPKLDKAGMKAQGWTDCTVGSHNPTAEIGEPVLLAPMRLTMSEAFL